MLRLAWLISASNAPRPVMRLIAESQASRWTVAAGTVPPHSSSPAGAPGVPASVSRVARMISCGRGPAPSARRLPLRHTSISAVGGPLPGRPGVGLQGLQVGIHRGPQGRDLLAIQQPVNPGVAADRLADVLVA